MQHARSDFNMCRSNLMERKADTVAFTIVVVNCSARVREGFIHNNEYSVCKCMSSLLNLPAILQ